MCDQDVSPQWMPTHQVTWSFGHVILQDKMVIYLKRAHDHKVTQRSDHVVLQNHLINENQHVSTNRVPMATKLDKMVTYLNEFLPIKSYEFLIKWSCEFM